MKSRLWVFLSLRLDFRKCGGIFRKKDDPRIVIDEVMGFLITMLWLPKTILFIILGFFLFRFFDILKPFPIRQWERKLKGGIGVVLDDVMAAIYANIILHLISSLFPSPLGERIG